ncbi:DUF6134 family protein [Mesonia maritima]|uniref:Uncharacterized protein n=1 Tax=Mesonia maritima TaxID=1793873 RepID=A0ABU1K7G2_9FLAO|nr:DUF6134 family protein [Mesonia maritima]MDR6301549.1 hypothetical protein [Mesonia maritima]
MNKFLLLSFLSFCSISTLLGQEEKYRFNILHREKIIGELVAKKEVLEDKIIYSNRTEISTRIIAKIEVDYTYKVVYTNNSLAHAFALILLNDREKTNAYTEKTKTGYIFYEDDEAQHKIDSPITYSTVNLMFEEPLTITKVYAEEHGEFHQLKKVAKNIYEKTNSKGKTSLYKYKNGKLVEAEIDAGIISFKIVAE